MDSLLIDIVFCVMFALVPLIALVLLRYAGVSLRIFSIPSLFIIFYLISAYIGIFPLYFGLDEYHKELGIIDNTIILKMFFYSSASLLLTTCGFIYAYHVIGMNNIVAKYKVLVSANRKQRVFVFCLILLCFFILLKYISQIETIALFKALDGDYLGAAVARSEMGNAFGGEGKFWHYQIFFRVILDYCVIFFFAEYLITRRRISGLIFGASFLVSAFSATMAIEKAPFIFLLVMLYLTIVIYKGGEYWQALAKYVVVAMISFITVFYIYFVGQEGIASSIFSIASRVFSGQIAPAYFYIDLFPSRISYLLGASFPNPGGLLPFHVYPLTMEVVKYMFPDIIAKGIVGSAPTVFWSEMYANFGLIGIIFSSFLVGTGLFLISYILSMLPLSPPVIAATVSLAMHYKDLSGTSLAQFFFDSYLIIISAVTLVSLLLNRRSIEVRRGIPATNIMKAHFNEK